MGFLDLIQIQDRKTRRTLEAVMLVIGAVYFGCITIIYSINPFPDMLPVLLIVITIPLALNLALVHWTSRLNAFMVLTGVAFCGIPFSIVMHNFLEDLARRAVDFVFLHYVLDFLHGAFFICALFVFPPLLVVGVIGAIVGLMHSTDGPENDF